MPTALGIVSVLVGAVGSGLSYAAGQSAAKEQETLSLLNAQTQTQAIRQQGQVNQMQAAINTALAKKEQEAANANARNIEAQANVATRASMDATRRSREDAARFAALQVASLAKGGFADTTGSPLALLADTAEKAQQEADTIRFQDEQNRRLMFQDASIARNQGVLAGLNVQSQRLGGLAAAQRQTAELAQARMNYYGQRAAASAARSGATGSLLNSLGGLAYQGYSVYQNAPRG